MRTSFEIQENCLTCVWRQKPWFCGASPTTLRRLQAITRLSAHSVGTVLYAEGKVAEGVFILCNGRAKISIESKRGSVIIL
jgi:CRP/FNR family transcriptional regulator